MTDKKYHFLVTNDDGINSPGLRALWEAVKDFAKVTVVAPDKQRSGSGLAITFDTPLTILPVSNWEGSAAFQVSGTPVDCVKSALSILMDQKPDMVLSGINYGTNSGGTILSSGTIGCALEACMRDIPGIAFSKWCYETHDFEYLIPYIRPIVEFVLEQKLPKGTIYNVNFPLEKQNTIKGLKVVKHGVSRWMETPNKHFHPLGHMHYQLDGVWTDHMEKDDTDVHFLKKGYITASPIHIGDLTDHNVLKNQKQNLESIFQKKFNFENT